MESSRWPIVSLRVPRIDVRIRTGMRMSATAMDVKTSTSAQALKAKMFGPLSQSPLKMYLMIEPSWKIVFTPSTEMITYRISSAHSPPMSTCSFCSGAFSSHGMRLLSQRAAAFTVEVRRPEGRITLKILESRPICSCSSLIVA